MLDPYVDLGLKRGASDEEVKAAFRRLAVSEYEFDNVSVRDANAPLSAYKLWLVCPGNHSSYPS